MTAVNGLDLAKQGNPKAIAALMNQTLQPKGITATATVSGNCLTVVAEADTLPDKTFLLDFIRQGVISLKPKAIERLIVQGKAKGEKHPGWRENVDLQAKPSVASSGVKPVSIVSSTQPEKRIALDKWISTIRNSANTLLLAGILLAVIGSGWSAKRTESQFWEYKIDSVEDLSFDTTMQRLGAEGWEMTSARRAVSGEGESSRGLYEVMFKRQITQSKAEQNLKNIELLFKQSIGKTYVGIINRSQHMYHIEHNSFSPSLAGLDSKIEPDSENYVFAVSLEGSDKAIATAVSKSGDLKSYTGAVTAVNGMTQTIACESDAPSRTAPASPTLNGSELQCAAGSSKLN